MSDRIEKLRQFLSQTPKDCFLNHALALEYIKAGSDEEAKLLFEKNLENEPSYVATYYHLGKLLERNGDIQAATEIYDRGMKAAKTANDMHTYSELQAAYEDLVY
jgi:Tfp pilus assembly protein PilF